MSKFNLLVYECNSLLLRKSQDSMRKKHQTKTIITYDVFYFRQKNI